MHSPQIDSYPYPLLTLSFPKLVINFGPTRHQIEPPHINHKNHMNIGTISIKTTKETRTMSRRLAGIHRRQAVQAKTRTMLITDVPPGGRD